MLHKPHTYCVWIANLISNLNFATSACLLRSPSAFSIFQVIKIMISGLKPFIHLNSRAPFKIMKLLSTLFVIFLQDTHNLKYESFVEINLISSTSMYMIIPYIPSNSITHLKCPEVEYCFPQ